MFDAANDQFGSISFHSWMEPGPGLLFAASGAVNGPRHHYFFLLAIFRSCGIACAEISLGSWFLCPLGTVASC